MNPTLFPLYSKILEDFDDPAWKNALRAYARYKTSEVKQRLSKLSKDQGIPKDIREEARIQYWSKFHNDVFSITFVMRGRKGGVVRLKNDSEREIEFAYRKLDEIFTFTAYLEQRGQPRRRTVVRKTSSTPEEAPSLKKVRILSGQLQEFSFDFENYTGYHAGQIFYGGMHLTQVTTIWRVSRRYQLETANCFWACLSREAATCDSLGR